jgi:hypothetical protein
MDVTLGPWTAAHAENKDLADAMGDEAWKTVEKSKDATPKKADPKTAAKGYTVSGRLTSADKKGKTTHIFMTFNILVDGFLSNVPPIAGTGFADAPNTPEDAVRAITESRINAIIQKLKTGLIVRQG